MRDSFDNIIVTFIFLAAVKLANVIFVFKKDSKTSKENFRPVSILANGLKIFELITFQQMCSYFDNIFLK